MLNPKFWKSGEREQSTLTVLYLDRLTDEEMAAVRWSLKRGSPFGNETWVESTARRLGLESTLRPRGRPQGRNLPIKDS